MFSLREYREPSSRLPDRLPWACLVAPGVVLQKDAIFQRTLAFRGPDLASSLDSELLSASARLNNALRRLGSGWALFIEAQRFLSSAYPAAGLAVSRGGRRRSRAEAHLRTGRRALRVELLPDLRVEAAARPRGARGGPLLRRRRRGFPRSRRAERARARALHASRRASPRSPTSCGRSFRRWACSTTSRRSRTCTAPSRPTAIRSGRPRRPCTSTRSCRTCPSRRATCRCSATTSSAPPRSRAFPRRRCPACSTRSTT